MPIYFPPSLAEQNAALINARNMNLSQISGGASGADVSGQSLIEEFATQEGTLLPIAYGLHLVAGTLIVHKYTGGGTPSSTFIVALGDGEWAEVFNAYWNGEALTNQITTTLWVNDAVPTGASAVGDTDGWNWVTNNPPPHLGTQSHQSLLLSGTHQHYFQGASANLSVATGDYLYCWVYLDPHFPPRELMLQWRTGTDFDHRVYWGENLISFGTDGTNSRRFMGELPPAGRWWLLGVPASQVGLEGTTLNGMAFTCYDGRATFDDAGKMAFSTSAGYRFHPGRISTGIYDILQGPDAYLPNGLAYSGTACVAVKLTTAQSSTDRPDKFRCTARTRISRTYDAGGNFIGYDGAAETALAIADCARRYFERRYYFDLDLAELKFWNRISWPEWAAFFNYGYNGIISWDDGTGGGPRNIRRFECHIAFTQAVDLATALDVLVANSAGWWQDDGEKLILLTAADRAPVHHFNESNIVAGSLQVVPQDLRTRPNLFTATFRNLEDTYLGLATVETRRDSLIERFGENPSERQFGTMTYSQAQRLLERQARIEADNAILVTLRGMGDSIHLLPGDYVTLSHSVPGWVYQKYLVTEAENLSPEEAPDLTDFTLQVIDGPLYSDDDHGPIQEAQTP